MVDVINLRMARKRKHRADHEQQGAENRAKFGRTRSEKQRDGRETDRGRQSLDDAKLDDIDPTP